MGDQARTPATLREAIASKLLLVILLYAAPLVLASLARTFRDGDTSWHLAVGQWMIRHGQIPSVDVFSYTAAGKHWVAMEWLSALAGINGDGLSLTELNHIAALAIAAFEAAVDDF